MTMISHEEDVDLKRIVLQLLRRQEKVLRQISLVFRGET